MPLVMPTMSTILACGSAARAAACTAGESGSAYFVCADAKQGTRTNRSIFKLRAVAITIPRWNEPQRLFIGDGNVLKRGSDGHHEINFLYVGRGRRILRPP